MEDHPDTCELIAAILDDYELISAGTVAEAEDMFRKESFDMALLDYHLPDGNGVELCKRLREIDPKVPILFVTGSSGISREHVLRIGAHGVVRKGTIDFADRLVEHVSRFCEPASA